MFVSDVSEGFSMLLKLIFFHDLLKPQLNLVDVEILCFAFLSLSQKVKVVFKLMGPGSFKIYLFFW